MPTEVLSVRFKSLHSQEGGGQTDFLKGAVGDRITATIVYTTQERHDRIEFRYELAPNSQSEGFSFLSPEGVEQLFGGGINNLLLPLGQDRDWQHGSARHESLGPNTFRIFHTFNISPFPDPGVVPEIYVADECPQYVFRINTFQGAESREELNSKTVQRPGDVGYLDELFNGGAPVWSVTHQEGDAVDDVLLFRLESTTPFPGAMRVAVHAIAVPTEISPALGLFDNYRFAEAFGAAGAQYYGGLRVQYFNATKVTDTRVDFILKLREGEYTGRNVLIWAIIGNSPANEADSVRQAVLLRSFSDFETQPRPTGVISLTEYPGAGFNGIGFGYHDDPSRLFSDVKAAIKDTITAKAKLSLAPGYTLRRLTVEIKSGAVVFERREFLTAENSTRNYILPPGDEFNRVRFDPASLELEYAFRIRWESWRFALGQTATQDWADAPTDIRFCLIAEAWADQTPAEAEFQSPPFQLTGYQETITQPGGPQVDVGSIQTYNALTGEQLGGHLSADQPTQVVATFSGATSTGLGAPLADLFGILSLDVEPTGGPQFIRTHSSLRPNLADGVFQPAQSTLADYEPSAPQPGGGFGRVTLSATIQPGLVGGTTQTVISARLDRTKGNLQPRGYRPIGAFCVQGAAATSFRPIAPFCFQQLRFTAFRGTAPFCLQEDDVIPPTTAWRVRWPYCVQCQPYGTFHRVLCEDGILYNEYHNGTCGYYRIASGCQAEGTGATGEHFASAIFSEVFIGDGTAQVFDILHDKNTRKYHVEVYDLATEELVEVGIERITEETVRVHFASPPADGAQFELVMTYLALTPVPCCNSGAAITLIGDGLTTEFDLPHTLGRMNVLAATYATDTNEKVDTGFKRIDPNTLRVLFFAPPEPGEEYEVVIV